MNKILKSLAIVALVAGSANAATNKTFLMPRSQGVNLAMEYTTWNELLQTKDEDRFGANFQLTPFYMDSTNKSDVGKYFGVADKNVMQVNTKNVATGDLIGTWMIHNIGAAGAATTPMAKIKLEPEQQAYGLRIDYYQDLEKILKGLYLKVALPIVHVQNDVNINVYDGQITDGKTATQNQTNLVDFFNGTYDVAAGLANAQTKLTHAKVSGSQSETGVADIDLVLGYKFLDKDKYHMSINLGLTIPVGTDADGVWMFEPIVGNGNHWGFGAGIDAGVKLWENDDQNIKLAFALNYRYLFESSENRTLGLKNITALTTNKYGQYFLASKAGAAIATAQGTPLANILTPKVDVTPGSQIDTILGLAYNNGGFNIEIGYNLFWKDSEEVSLKGWSDTDPWALVHETADFTLAFAAVDTRWSNGTYGNGAVVYADAYKVTAANIDTDAAATPSQITNKIFGGLGYIFKDWEYPLMLGIAGQYEFASSSALENWGIWGKLGVAF